MELGDGIVFDPDSVKADAIREDNTYGGTRITLVARIGSARCGLQIDVGFGDAVTPGPQTVGVPGWPVGLLQVRAVALIPSRGRSCWPALRIPDAGAGEGSRHSGCLLRAGWACL